MQYFWNTQYLREPPTCVEVAHDEGSPEDQNQAGQAPRDQAWNSLKIARLGSGQRFQVMVRVIKVRVMVLDQFQDQIQDQMVQDSGLGSYGDHCQGNGHQGQGRHGY